MRRVRVWLSVVALVLAAVAQAETQLPRVMP